MRQVYDTPGPEGGQVQRAHGVADAPSVTLLDPLSDECWDHWATNSSMLGAIGPLDLVDFLYRGHIAANKVVVPALLMGATTGALIYTRGYQQPNFPRGLSSDDEEEQKLIHDRDVFLERLAARTQLDFLNLATAYAQNAFNSPDGTESARGIDPKNEPIKMLSVPPLTTNDPRPVIPNVHYVDPPNNTLGLARKVMWRSNIENVCRESTADLSSVILNLRTQCRGLAPNGGDPDSWRRGTTGRSFNPRIADTIRISSPSTGVLEAKTSSLKRASSPASADCRARRPLRRASSIPNASTRRRRADGSRGE
jgi:hypothetical protein